LTAIALICFIRAYDVSSRMASLNEAPFTRTKKSMALPASPVSVSVR